MMYKQSLSIKSMFVDLTYDRLTDDRDKSSSSDDSIRSYFVRLTDGE